MISVRTGVANIRPAEAKVMRIGNKILLGFLAVILAITLMATQDYLTIFTSLLVGGVASRILSRMIAHRMEELVGATRVISQGDLTKTVAVDSRDELGQLAAATNQVTEELATRVHQIAKGAERQVVLVGDGSRVVHDLAHSANEIAARSRSAAQAVAEAGDTDARGGKHGRGFAGVADEVRKLAGDAGSSAEQIAKLAQEIREESAQVLTSMEMAGKGIESGRQGLPVTEKAVHG